MANSGRISRLDPLRRPPENGEGDQGQHDFQRLDALQQLGRLCKVPMPHPTRGWACRQGPDLQQRSEIRAERLNEALRDQPCKALGECKRPRRKTRRGSGTHPGEHTPTGEGRSPAPLGRAVGPIGGGGWRQPPDTPHRPSPAVGLGNQRRCAEPNRAVDQPMIAAARGRPAARQAPEGEPPK